jgi:hypothetical protein
MGGITRPFAVDLGKPKEELKIIKKYIYSLCFFDFTSLMEESNKSYIFIKRAKILKYII